jgi:hypothetical protein
MTAKFHGFRLIALFGSLLLGAFSASGGKAEIPAPAELGMKHIFEQVKSAAVENLDQP